MKILGADIREIKSPNAIQSQDYSRGGVIDDIRTIFKGSVCVNSNGNRCVAYLNRNDSKRNLNLNRVDNRWNDNCRFLARR